MEHTIDEEETLSDALSQRVRELGIYLGLPDWYEVKYEGAPRHPLFGHLWQFGGEVGTFRRTRMHATASHTARVTLDSMVLADMLGFGRGTLVEDSSFQGQFLVEAALYHDAGKILPGIREISEKKVGFTEEDRKKMRDHVWMAGSVSPEAWAIMMDHHRWQRTNPYTPFSPLRGWIRGKLGLPHFQRTPESLYLSKILGIIDCHDAAATRVNERSGGKPMSADEVRSILMREYGDLRIRYSGHRLPESDMSGEQLIETLYDNGIFGRDNPLNPCEEPYSFIRRADKREEADLREKMKEREAEVKKKFEKYGHQDSEEIYSSNK